MALPHCRQNFDMLGKYSGGGSGSLSTDDVLLLLTEEAVVTTRVDLPARDRGSLLQGILQLSVTRGSRASLRLSACCSGACKPKATSSEAPLKMWRQQPSARHAAQRLAAPLGGS